MSLPSPIGRRRPIAVALATVALTALAVAGPDQAFAQDSAAAPTGGFTDGLYIVQLAEAPVGSYDGHVAGMRATQPRSGAKLDRNSADVQRYRGHLADRHDAVLARVPRAKKVYDYTYTFNGFAARLTGRDAAMLARTPGVVRLTKNQLVHADTISTPDFLGLTGANGVWQQRFGGAAHAGEGVIVGEVDSGFWPENPSFGPLPEPRPDAYVIGSKWHGTCDQGAETDPTRNVTCNNKVIGARWYNSGVNAIPEEFHSPRDWGGHGSHTASTAAGNNGVPVTINGQSIGSASGMAPAARLAIYKVCWSTDYAGGNSCGTTDSVAAIDQAVADGVDVINYSISGARTTNLDPVEVAFFNAAAAGVFVSVSAGNNGDSVGVSSVAHNAPWETTVAASTHDRAFQSSVTLGNGTTATGAGNGAAVPSSPLIASENAGKAGADPAQVLLCFSGTLDPAKVTGKIVTCQRGNNARTDKSLAVQQAGGVGAVIYNVAGGAADTAADFHFVPTVHLDAAAGAPVHAYALTAGATASLAAGQRISVQAPVMGSFSSYGPALAGGGDLLKPDITAPGVDIIAAVAPPGNGGHMWDSFQGTSMSTPHISGLAALILSTFPGWSPTAVKSAIMTTASQTDNHGAAIARQGMPGPATPLDYGAGHVVPSRIFDPGLVYESGAVDWIRFLCGSRDLPATDGNCQAAGSIDPSDLNYPSISIGDLAGAQTITRTVRNVGKKNGNYKVAVQVPAGFTVQVSPTHFVVKPGKTATYTVKISRTTAAFGTYGFGSLTWSDNKGHAVRSPIAVRPVPLAAPAEVTGTGASGSTPVPVQPGFTGTLDSAVNGLVPATVTDLALKNPSSSGFDPADPQTADDTGKVTVVVPAGTTIARFATFGADYPSGTDVDVFLYRQTAGGLELVGQSAGGTAEESVTLTAPEAGTYEFYVNLFGLPAGQTEATIKPHTWVVGGTAAGNATVAPASTAVTSGQPTQLTLSWSGLTAGVRYLGQVAYSSGGSAVGSTIVRIDG